MRHGGYLGCSPARSGRRPEPAGRETPSAPAVHGRPKSPTSRRPRARPRAPTTWSTQPPSTGPSPSTLKSELDEERRRGREVVDHDAHVLQALNRHALGGKASTMPEPTACARARFYPDSDYCDRCDLLVGLDGFHVIDVAEREDRRGCPYGWWSSHRHGRRAAGLRVIAHSHGRRTVRLVDAPCMGRPVEVVWRKRTWRCGGPTCPTGGWTELKGDLARPRALLTTRACWWAIGQLRREHASVAGLPGSWARPGGPCGGRFNRCSKRWPRTRPGSPM
jgi:hypothetical protein